MGEDYPWYPVVGIDELESPTFMEYLRKYNSGGKSLPNIVNSGPPGCIETTYSFDWGNNHFVVLNQYYDGTSDDGSDGMVVPELLAWLENDLTANDKKYTFVFGHEPIIAIPDMDNGRLRHQDDSLNKYQKNNYHFHQLLRRLDVTAYICGHTHNTSIAKINDVWQIDVGHARGIEAYFPALLVNGFSQAIAEAQGTRISEREAFARFYKENSYEAKKVLYYSGLTDGVFIKRLMIKPLFTKYIRFINSFRRMINCEHSIRKHSGKRPILPEVHSLKYIQMLTMLKSTIYRDDARGGAYTLMHTKMLV